MITRLQVKNISSTEIEGNTKAAQSGAVKIKKDNITIYKDGNEQAIDEFEVHSLRGKS